MALAEHFLQLTSLKLVLQHCFNMEVEKKNLHVWKPRMAEHKPLH